MSNYYTRLGDEGFTQLLGQGRVPKYHPRPEALGAVDEASAALGFARASTQNVMLKQNIFKVQRDLYQLMAELAATPENAEQFRFISQEQLLWVEKQIEQLSAGLPALKEFIIAGDTLPSAAFAVARTAMRRAERRVSALIHNGELDNPNILPYLNRLSSLCFVMELFEIHSENKATSSVTSNASSHASPFTMIFGSGQTGAKP